MFYYCLRGKAIKKRANNVDNIFSFKIPVSVSYTHLRAHETRHDLVCRLLLEKKKKKTIEIIGLYNL